MSCHSENTPASENNGERKILYTILKLCTLLGENVISQRTLAIQGLFSARLCANALLKDPAVSDWCSQAFLHPGTPPIGCHFRDIDLYLQRCEERSLLQHQPCTQVAITAQALQHISQGITDKCISPDHIVKEGFQGLLTDSWELFTQYHLERPLLAEGYLICWHCCW